MMNNRSMLFPHHLESRERGGLDPGVFMLWDNISTEKIEIAVQKVEQIQGE